MSVATPSEIVRELLDIAERIERSASPSRSAVAASIEDVLALLGEFRVATDRSIAVSIRDALHAKIQELVPGEVSELYDTHEGGKGFRSGYVSFGLKPMSWQNSHLIGGILVSGSYDSKSFRSEKPEGAGKDFKHSKGEHIITVELTASYYNKKPGGDVETQGATVPLGTATVHIGDDESIIEVEVDSSKLGGGINHLIQEIVSNPPDYAKSKTLLKKHNAPTGSPQSLRKWLNQNGRSDVEQGELEALARAMAARGKPYSNAMDEVTKYFRSRGFPIKPG